MKKIILILALLVSGTGCRLNPSKAEIALLGVKADIQEARAALVEAKTCIDRADQTLIKGGAGVATATKEVIKTDKAAEIAKEDLEKLKTNPWVRSALWLRNFLYTILAAYIVSGLLAAILGARGIAVGATSQILDLLPLSQIFKAVGYIFKKPKEDFFS